MSPDTVTFQPPTKVAGTYLMRPMQPLLLQTPELVCVDGLTSGPTTKITLKLDGRVQGWLCRLESRAVAYAKEHKMELFNKELDDLWIEQSFKTCISASGDSATFKLADEVAVFSDKKEVLGPDAVRPDTRVALLLDFKGVEFGRKSFALRMRITAFRVATRLPYMFLDEVEYPGSESDSDSEEEPEPTPVPTILEVPALHPAPAPVAPAPEPQPAPAPMAPAPQPQPAPAPMAPAPEAPVAPAPEPQPAPAPMLPAPEPLPVPDEVDDL